VKKGSRLYIEGKLTTRSWDDKEGAKRYKTEVVAFDISLLSPARVGQWAVPAGQRVQTSARWAN